MCQCVPDSQRARVSLDPTWLSRDGGVVHPDAPAGAGGAGFFRAAGAIATDGGPDQLAHPGSAVAPGLETSVLDRAQRLQEAEVARQPPPVVTTAKTMTIQTMTVTIKPDESGAQNVGSALTDVTQFDGGARYVHSKDTGKVISWTLLPYRVEIVTMYGTGTPNSDAAYGRGTTAPDVAAGNVTLGFHESCHRDDMVAYLKGHPLPAFKGKAGVTTDEGDALIQDYNDAIDAYFQAARDHSRTVTDEVT